MLLMPIPSTPLFSLFRPPRTSPAELTPTKAHLPSSISLNRVRYNLGLRVYVFYSVQFCFDFVDERRCVTAGKQLDTTFPASFTLDRTYKSRQAIMEGDEKPTADIVRVRRYHTRNRTGCATCRRRHVRCDEKRPACSNCLSGKRACEYPTMQPTLRERRSNHSALPGQQQPWAVHQAQGLLSFSVAQLTRSASGDPFDTLAVQMPLKSQELFHYFTQKHNTSSVSQKQPTCLDAVVHDPYALRSTLIIAGLHYSWNTGRLQSFEPTFLFHKVESIRTINDWMGKQDATRAAVAVRQVLTLGFAECCLGNLPAAETHLHGLMALLDIADPYGLGRMGTDEVDSELADRYLILSHNFLHGLKSRFDKDSPQTVSPGRGSDSQVSDTFSRMHMAHIAEPMGLENRLISLAKFPHFFAPPPRGRKPVDIDALSVVESLRDITTYVDHKIFGWDNPEDFFAAGGPTRLFVTIVDLHVLSFSGKAEKIPQDETRSPNFMSSWSGVCTAMGLYLHSVLGIWNAGRPMSSRLLCRLIQILKRHLARDRQRLGGKGGLDRGFWLWKTFTGAMALASTKYAVTYGSSSSSSSVTSPSSASTAGSAETSRGINDVEALEEWFLLSIKKWSKMTDIKTWEEARVVLSKVVWPINLSSESLAISLWQRAMEVRP